MKKLKKSSILPYCLTSFLLLAGCDTGPNSNNQQTGQIVGGVAGAMIGNEVSDGDPVGVAIGAILGSAIGQNIGRDIDQKNRQRMAYVLENQRSYRTSRWIDPDTGVVYEMKPSAAYAQNQTVCRPFTLRIQGQDGDFIKNGTACRRNDGSWELVN